MQIYRRRLTAVNPAVRRHHLKLKSRSLGDSRGDWEFLWEALIQEKNLSAEITADYCVLRKIALTGIIAKSGRFNKHLPSRRLRKNESGKTEFVLAWARETAIDQDIVLTQGDVRAVQLAKAAPYTGARYLVEKLDQMTAACK